MSGVDPRVEIRQARAIFACCAAFGLDRGDRLDVATTLLDRNVESFRHLHPGDIERLWFAFNGAVYIAKILMDKKAQRMSSPAENNIDQARARLDRAQRDLNDLIASKCPGSHAPVQHRDRRLPWCDTCRRDLRGHPVPR